MTKNNKTRRALLALTLSLLLSLTASLPALAADMPALEGSLAYTPPIAITKILQTPEGTIIPTAEFTFKLDKYGIGSEDTVGTIKNQMPAISNVTVTVSNTDVRTTSNYIDTITKESLITLSGLDFTAYGPGQYIYTITESGVTGYPSTGITIYTHESKAKYELSLYVARDSVEPHPLYIQYITVRKLVKDNGQSLGVDEEKVDPSPGKHGLAFVNTYVKANDGKPDTNVDPDPENPSYQNLIIEKMVVDSTGSHIGGEYAYFPFRITLTNADFVEDPLEAEPVLVPPLLLTYKAYVLNSSGSVVADLTPNGGTPAGTDSNGSYYLFTVEVPQTLNLQDGQKLVFTRTPVGTKWVAVEALTGKSTPFDAYTASILVTVNQEMDPAIIGIKGKDVTTFDRLVGEGDTIALFKNFAGTTPPLGLDIDNLPYYGLIALAVGALAVYVIVKTRKARKSAHN